jgi:ethanolamine ammonia-lyase small subunit
VLHLSTHASTLTEYLAEPERGCRLSAASARMLENACASCDVAFIIADGLSAAAVERHAPPVLDSLMPRLRAAGLNAGPLCIVKHGRVAIGDEIGALVHARMVVVLIGERPGLSSPDSMGVYVTWAPRPGRTNAERNCISNIHARGLRHDAAAGRLFWLIGAALQAQLTGVALKEDAPLPPAGPVRPLLEG